MIYINDSGLSQSINYIGRDGDAYLFEFTDEQSNESFYKLANGFVVASQDFNTFTDVFDFAILDHVYNIKVYTDGVIPFLDIDNSINDKRASDEFILYRGLLRVVSASENTSGNFSDIIEHKSSNEYIILN